jgi:DNA repair exonuclease SbcCD ATPase subunit
MIFREIQWKNLFSYGKGITKVRLDANETVNIVGINGAGKSVFVEAIFYALTGKPMRKCKIDQMVNTTNKKNMWVKVKIQSGNHEYEIERGTKPKVFSIKIDGEPLDEQSKALAEQDYLELMLGYKRTNLKHTLIMSTTDYTPFLRLTAADKRAFIEDILAIEIFTVMNKIVKAKLSVLKEEMQDIHNQIDKLEYKLDMIRDYNKEHNTTNELMIDEVREKIARDEGLIGDLEKKIEALSEKSRHHAEKAEGIKQDANVIESKLKDREGIRDQQQDKFRKGMSKGQEVLTQIRTQISVKNKDLDFFEGNDICPKCRQPMEGQGIDDCLDELKAEIEALTIRQEKVQTELGKVEKLGLKVWFEGAGISGTEDRSIES